MFNIFCPIFLSFSIKTSLIFFLFYNLLFFCLFFSALSFIVSNKFNITVAKELFPIDYSLATVMLAFFMLVGFFNLSSLVVYSFPITTVLANNLSLAMLFWFSSVMMILFKSDNVKMLLPENAPWYLAPFLCLVEAVSILVRPVTLSFRLLANMSAGHILLSLICKMSFFMWLLGTIFGMLEIMVSLVQSFVFFMLFSVYIDESLTH